MVGAVAGTPSAALSTLGQRANASQTLSHTAVDIEPMQGHATQLSHSTAAQALQSAIVNEISHDTQISLTRVTVLLDRLNTSVEAVLPVSESGQQAISAVNRFVDSNDVSAVLEIPGLNPDDAPAGGSPQDRRLWLLEQTRQLLEGCSTLSSTPIAQVGLRTGLIVLVSTLARHAVGYALEQAREEHDPSQERLALASAAALMIGPVMTVLGALRDEHSGSATWQSRAGRACMCTMSMGATLAAYLTGNLPKLAVSSASATFYALCRDAMNAFFPMTDNAGRPSLPATSSAMVGYGGVQALLSLASGQMPAAGAARAAAEQNYNVFADLAKSVLNSAGAVADDTLEPWLRWLCPADGGVPDGLADHERAPSLQVTFERRLPSGTNVMDQMFNSFASRACAINTLIAWPAVATTILDRCGVSGAGRVVADKMAEVAGLMATYVPYVYTGFKEANSWTPPWR